MSYPEIFSLVLPFICIILFLEYRQYTFRKRLSKKSVIKSNIEYPNNHHLPGVGYFHASSARWHACAWNEYQEGRGYYWDGEWHTTPDQRQCSSAVPSNDEVARLNKAWREARISNRSLIEDDIERGGFGTSPYRAHGG